MPRLIYGRCPNPTTPAEILGSFEVIKNHFTPDMLNFYLSDNELVYNSLRQMGYSNLEELQESDEPVLLKQLASENKFPIYHNLGSGEIRHFKWEEMKEFVCSDGTFVVITDTN